MVLNDCRWLVAESYCAGRWLHSLNPVVVVVVVVVYYEGLRSEPLRNLLPQIYVVPLRMLVLYVYVY